jgi:hypothetical protein
MGHFGSFIRWARRSVLVFRCSESWGWQVQFWNVSDSKLFFWIRTGSNSWLSGQFLQNVDSSRVCCTSSAINMRSCRTPQVLTKHEPTAIDTRNQVRDENSQVAVGA